jgi:enoyl-CoA hydratase/carnithine racemase
VIVRSVPTSTPEIVATVTDGVGWIVLNRPEKHNALSPAMFGSLAQLADAWNQDDEVRVVAIRGAGERAFASGADIGELTPTSGGGARVTTLAIGKPVVAMIHGYCIGGGLMLAMEADLRICTPDAVFGIPAARLGAGYPYESVQRLVALAGPARAAEILLLGGRYDAAAAHAMGLVNEVVSHGELEERVRAVTATLRDNAPLSLAASKAAIAAAVGLRGSSADTVQELIRACWVSEDFAEGRAAFAEKRVPNFGGR